MEILGIVWAASILNQPSPVNSVVEPLAELDSRKLHDQQPTSSIGEEVSWLSHLERSYGWSTLYADIAANYNSDISLVSLPELGPGSVLASLNSVIAEVFPDQESDFAPLQPIVSAGLVELKSAFAESAELDNPEQVIAFDQWDRWDAVAAVRLLDLEQPPVASEPPAIANRCLATSAIPYQTTSTTPAASSKQQLWVYDHFIGEVKGHGAAHALVDKLRVLIKEGLEPSHLQPLFGSNFAGGALQSELLFVVDESMRSHPEVPAAAIAMQWINNLRIAFDEAPLDLVQVQMAIDGLQETSEVIYGTASWYGPGFHGRLTANGERFDENTLTAAHKSLPFNTRLKVTNRSNGKSVVVRINDRGPYIGTRSIDLSKAAAECLGGIGKGVISYEAVFLDTVPKPSLDELATAQAINE